MTLITSEEIVEGNKLIAVFLGYTWYPFSAKNPTYTNDPGWKLHPASRKYVSHKQEPFYNSKTIPPFIFSKSSNFPGSTIDPIPNPDYHSDLSKPNTYLCRKHQELPFYNSWEWIHKVLDKVVETKGRYHISAVGCYIITLSPTYIFGQVDTNIRVATFRSIIEYINWYNEKVK